jgi:hypothetical protein
VPRLLAVVLEPMLLLWTKLSFVVAWYRSLPADTDFCGTIVDFSEPRENFAKLTKPSQVTPLRIEIVFSPQQPKEKVKGE